jgi:hypothetical protein
MTVSETPAGEVRDIVERGHPIVHIERSAGPLVQATLDIEIPPLAVSVKMRPVPPESGVQ